MPFKARITKIDQGIETEIELQYGIISISFKDIPRQRFYAVVIKGFAQKPMILLTNLQVEIKKPNDVYSIIERYLTRCKCDECFRYKTISPNFQPLSLIKKV